MKCGFLKPITEGQKERIEKMKVVIGRHINGITINPLEYLLDEDEEPMIFESEEIAKDFLKEKGFTDDDIYWFIFVVVTG